MPRRRPGLPTSPDLPSLEREVLRRWQERQVFARSLEQTAGGPRWIVYDGPPTANGMPGVHHVAARVLKDLFPRFKTMQGFHVPRRPGWDCHGLPVEVAVEKELGLHGKPDIEAYGVGAFNARCRESVLRHIDAFAELTRRMGYWTDLSAAYKTMDPSYIESVWWALKQIHDRGLLVRDFRVSPYCPRCGTPLSDHEMGQEDVYRTVADPSVTVRFRLLALPASAPPELAGADLLVWTTTPWTLVANTAVAVHPEQAYVLARRSGVGDRVVVAEALMGRVLGEGWHVMARLTGAQLAGAAYRPPLTLVDVPARPGAPVHTVVTGPFVTTADGTGLVHVAPAFGADDMAVGKAHGLPLVNPVQPDGRFEPGLPLVGGMFFKAADEPLIASLADRDLLFSSHTHQHSYPHCWRCGTPLLYYALPSWFITTTAVRDQLLAQNAATNWQPPSIRDGRYGGWLRGNVDWALSRTRYWGTPLPLWVCASEHVTCVGSLAELSRLAGWDVTGIDPHRPFVDEVVISCPDCGAPARRVPEVADVWFDSGSMPFAQFGAPLRNSGSFVESYPAQFVCEAVDQTRGWFYSLMAVGTLVFGQSAYQNVVCLGLVVDEQGRKMSKHLGNVLEPIAVLDSRGADALRWFFAASGSPFGPRRLSGAALDDIVRKVLLTYWNTAAFLVLYAEATAGGTPALAPEPAGRPAMDRWILSELHLLVTDVTAALEAFDAAAAGRRLAAFIDDVSNWYVRRSRRRFGRGLAAADGAAAFATLTQVLDVLTRLMAPIAPFITDYVWDVLRADSGPESVHLAPWPAADNALADADLAEKMALVRRLVELGRSARASAVVKVRQPLSKALIAGPGVGALDDELRGLIAEELNVAEVTPLDPRSRDRASGTDGADGADGADASGAGLVQHAVKPNFRALGRRFGDRTPAVAAAISAADPAAVARALDSGGTAVLDVDGAQVSVGPDEVVVTQTPAAGWAVAADNGEMVALALTVTPQLRREGLARETVRIVQDARKADGMAVTDHVALRWSTTDSELAQALTEHGATLAAEVLADEVFAGAPDDADDWERHDNRDMGLSFWLRAAPPRRPAP